MKMSPVRKIVQYIVMVFVVVFVVLFSWYLFNRFSFSKEIPFYSVKSAENIGLTIGVIGDSWVAGKKLDSLLHNAFLDRGIESKIISSGRPGAKSKFIYQNLFKETSEEYSSRFIIESNPDYCIVIAGVNDAAAQMGSRYYSNHMIEIVKTLLHYNIKPVIVSLPEVGVVEFLSTKDIYRRGWNIISAYVNNRGEIDNVRDYRKAFQEALESAKLTNRILMIDFDNVCKDYNKCEGLYKDPLHLSLKGNKELARVLCDELLNVN